MQVVLAGPADRFRAVPAHQLDILTRMDIPVTTGADPSVEDGRGRPDLIVDALIGYSLAGDPTGLAAALIRWTLALPKTGLLNAPEAGHLSLADISVPPLVYQRMGIEVGNLFGEASIITVVSAR